MSNTSTSDDFKLIFDRLDQQRAAMMFLEDENQKKDMEIARLRALLGVIVEHASMLSEEAERGQMPMNVVAADLVGPVVRKDLSAKLAVVSASAKLEIQKQAGEDFKQAIEDTEWMTSGPAKNGKQHEEVSLSGLDVFGSKTG